MQYGMYWYHIYVLDDSGMCQSDRWTVDRVSAYAEYDTVLALYPEYRCYLVFNDSRMRVFSGATFATLNDEGVR